MSPCITQARCTWVSKKKATYRANSMKHVPKRGSLIPFEFTQREKWAIFSLRKVGLLGRGGGNSFERAVTDDGSTMQDVFFLLISVAADMLRRYMKALLNRLISEGLIHEGLPLEH